MRVLYVVQRYGKDIAGGAEQHCREMAERLARRGHDVAVATTCAQSYVDWANVHEPGESEIDGVAVRRFPVAHPRDNAVFNPLNLRLTTSVRARPMAVQMEWMRLQGPHTPELARWLAAEASSFDCVVCFTYLYWTTCSGLSTCQGIVPTVLHPTVHDEPPLALSLFDQVFRAPDAFALSSPEEIDLIRDRFGIEPAGDVVGIGVELGRATPDRFHAAFPRCADVPYLLYVGRIDPGKGAIELYEHFVEYKRRHPGPLTLVFVGEPVVPVPRHRDVVVTGFVDTEVRDSAIAGALALAQPSRYESFSMILTEAFAQGRPGLVQSECAVLAGHARRSRGALTYRDFAEFEVALGALVEDRAVADGLGENGRRYVHEHYSWEVVMNRYEALLERVARTRRDRPVSP
jgi:glycosyltransferase involved in cell wall biosynthesis